MDKIYIERIWVFLSSFKIKILPYRGRVEKRNDKRTKSGTNQNFYCVSHIFLPTSSKKRKLFCNNVQLIKGEIELRDIKEIRQGKGKKLI